YNVALNLASTVPDWMESIRATPMVLGLDLQGGVHFLMEVDQAAALEKRENAFADDIRGLLRDNSIAYSEVARGSDGISITLRDAADRGKVGSLISADIPELLVSDGSDALSMVARIRDADLKAILDNALEQNIGTLRKRVDELGVAEPVILR